MVNAITRVKCGDTKLHANYGQYVVCGGQDDTLHTAILMIKPGTSFMLFNMIMITSKPAAPMN